MVGETRPQLVENLYDTASNVSVLRELRGNCVVRNGHCQEHNRPARKITTRRSIWTKNVKTGIFGYRRKKVSVLRCDGTTVLMEQWEREMALLVIRGLSQ